MLADGLRAVTPEACIKASDPKVDPTFGIHPMLFLLKQRIV